MSEVEACSYFVTFLGARYGWRPARDDLKPATYARFPFLNSYIPGRSVTECEIIYGAPYRPVPSLAASAPAARATTRRTSQTATIATRPARATTRRHPCLPHEPPPPATTPAPHEPPPVPHESHQLPSTTPLVASRAPGALGWGCESVLPTRRAFFYIRSDSYLDGLPPEEAAACKEQDAFGKSKLRDLKRRLESRHRESEELSGGCASGAKLPFVHCCREYAQPGEFAEALNTDLIAAIEQDYAASVFKPKNELDARFVAHVQYCKPLCRIYIGQGHVYDAIERYTSSGFYSLGEARSGGAGAGEAGAGGSGAAQRPKASRKAVAAVGTAPTSDGGDDGSSRTPLLVVGGTGSGKSAAIAHWLLAHRRPGVGASPPPARPATRLHRAGSHCDRPATHLHRAGSHRDRPATRLHRAGSHCDRPAIPHPSRGPQPSPTVPHPLRPSRQPPINSTCLPPARSSCSATSWAARPTRWTTSY